MNKELKNEIMSTVRAAARAVAENNEEVWLTTTQMAAHFPMFNKYWLRMYGHMLPRERVIVTMPDGTEKEGDWAYPRNLIQHKLTDGEFRKMEYVGKDGRKPRKKQGPVNAIHSSADCNAQQCKSQCTAVRIEMHSSVDCN